MSTEPHLPARVLVSTSSQRRVCRRQADEVFAFKPRHEELRKCLSVGMEGNGRRSLGLLSTRSSDRRTKTANKMRRRLCSPKAIMEITPVIPHVRWQERYYRIQRKSLKQDAGHSLPHFQSSGTLLSFRWGPSGYGGHRIQGEQGTSCRYTGRNRRSIDSVAYLMDFERIGSSPVVCVLFTWSLCCSRESPLFAVWRSWLVAAGPHDNHFIHADFSSSWAPSSRSRCCRCS